MMKALVLFVTTLLISDQVLASGGEGVPTETLVAQVVNLSILVLIIFFTQRKKVAESFAAKKESFLKSVDEASASKKQAEQTFREVSDRLSEMQTTYSQQVEEAKVNAEESYRSQVANAKNEAVRLKSATQTGLDFEVQRQIENLRLETFQKSADAAEKKMEQSLTPDQQKAWNNHFTAGAQGVH